MSTQYIQKRKTISNIKKAKGRHKLVALTAYTSNIASAIDPFVDCILVGDSVGMVYYGMKTTVAVTLEMMIAHGKAVTGSTQNALIVVDMSFGSYQAAPEKAYENAVRLMKETGCGAVKLEGGTEMAETVRFLTSRGIAVLGHVGLKPQSVHAEGGYRIMGKTQADKEIIMYDAKAIAEAGAFAIVLECVEACLTKDITAAINVPTIGIGSSGDCDGQILVTEDMVGLTGGRMPSFVKQRANVMPLIEKAVSDYARDIRADNSIEPEKVKAIQA